MPTINGTSGDDNLNGTSEVDQLFGLAGNDILQGWDGDDVIDGGMGDDYLVGGADNDSLTGGDGTDLIYGDGGNDILDGGIGSDTLRGGDGDDVYYVDTALDLIQESDLDVGIDLVRSTGATYSLPNYIENLELLGSSNLRGTGNSLDNLIIGNSGNNSLHGVGGNDILLGNEGDDTLTGGDGNDSLNGGAGSDTANYSASGLLGVTVDLSISGAQDTGVSSGIDTLIDIENLMGSYNGNDTLIGNSDANRIDGLTGNDMLHGGDGNDTLEGGAGDDTLDGGEGNDTASYASATSWVGVHLSSASPQDTAGAGIDTLISIENLIGSDFSDILSGNDGANRLEGGGSYDVLIGGLGNDFLDGGEGSDEANYLSAPSAVNVNLALSGPQNTGGAGVDTLVSIESVRGSQYDDVLRGDAGDNGLVGQGGDDWLFGGAGNDALNGTDGYDRMYGGAGNDIYYVSDDTDFAYELADQGQDFVLAWVDHQLRDNVEDLQLMTNGTGVIGKGNALDNGLIGNDFGNKLYGYNGIDMLSGNGGDDWLFGGGGNDYLHGGSGYDRMYGGTGDDFYAVTDTTDYAYENAGEGTDTVMTTINHSLRANIEKLRLDGSNDLRGYGNSLNNVIDGNYGNNLLYGRDGSDDLRGFDGNDILYGENGNDLLQGGTGQDRFYGGSGSDTFLFRSGDLAGLVSGTADRIHDFSQAEGDKINLYEVDFNSLVDGFQGHIFIGNAAFSGTAGEMRYEQVSGQTYIRIDTDGDSTADLAIRLDGIHELQASDFII